MVFREDWAIPLCGGLGHYETVQRKFRNRKSSDQRIF